MNRMGGLLILPMNIRCLTCENHMWTGTQFDAHKDDYVPGENYLEYRIHFNCKNCSSEIIFKRDPQNSDYIVESGATRDCRPWPTADEARALMLKYEQELQHEPVRAPLQRIKSANQMEGLFLLPMSITCLACDKNFYTGAQFNALREAVLGEEYLGQQVYRIYFECTKCSSGITLKTDPQNSDFVVESGAVRKSKPWPNRDEIRAIMKEYERAHKIRV